MVPVSAIAQLVQEMLIVCPKELFLCMHSAVKSPRVCFRIAFENRSASARVLHWFYEIAVLIQAGSSEARIFLAVSQNRGAVGPRNLQYRCRESRKSCLQCCSGLLVAATPFLCYILTVVIGMSFRKRACSFLGSSVTILNCLFPFRNRRLVYAEGPVHLEYIF